MLIAAALVVSDVIVLGSFYVAGVLLFIVIPLNLFKTARQRADRRVVKQKLVYTGIYAVAATLIIAFFP